MSLRMGSFFIRALFEISLALEDVAFLSRLCTATSSFRRFFADYVGVTSKLSYLRTVHLLRFHI